MPPPPAPVIARLARPHPAWQWGQLIAEVCRERTQAQAFFSPRVTRGDPATLVGDLTAPDLYRCFHNDWLARATVDWTAQRSTLCKLFLSSRQPATAGVLESLLIGRGEAPSNEPLSIATPADCDELSQRSGVNPYQNAADQPACFAEQATHCELLSTCVVDCLVAYLQERPGLELDALLDRQHRLAKDRVEAMRVLGQDLGL